MNIDEIFARKRVVFSFEVFPPKSTTPIESIYRTIDSLTGLEPDFISVTYGAGGSGAMDATADIAALIKSRGIEPLAHLTCLYHSAAQIDAVAQKLKEMGLTNILALRGDRRPDMPALMGRKRMPAPTAVPKRLSIQTTSNFVQTIRPFRLAEITHWI